VLLVAALVALVVALLAPRLGHHLAALVASPTLTPGVVNPAVTQANIGKTICVRGWTKTIRPPASYTTPLKLEQMRAYGLPGTPADYQEDHLISLELGGDPTDVRNLWPEPRPQADHVDRIENQLNAEICSGKITLAEGRRRISALKHTRG
jgi:hypothetical protein